MERRRLLATVTSVALTALGGCDALIGLGEPPSGELPASSAGSAVASSSSTSTAGGGDASTASSGSSSSGEGGGASAAAAGGGGSGGAGGGGAGEPTDRGCGPCDAAGCVTTCADAAACLVRVVDVPGTSRGGSRPDPDALRERLGRDIVVTDEIVAFARRRADGGPAVLTFVPRDGGAPFDAGGELGTEVAGIAPSGDGALIAITPHAGPPLQLVWRDGDPTVENVSAEALGLPAGTLFGAIAAIGDGRTFVAAHRDTGDLYRIELEPRTLACRVGGRDVHTPPVDVEATPAGQRVRVLRYFGLGDAEEYGDVLSCPGSTTTPIPFAVDGFDAHHAFVTRSDVTYVLGVRGGSAYVRAGTAAEVQAFPGFGLDVTSDGVLVPGRSGGLRRCDHGLAGCDTIAPAAAVGHVSHVRAVGDVIYTVGMSADTSQDVAKIACIVEP